MNENTRRLHARVYGRVQGVNFRYYTRQQALSLGITGWVANRPDRSVQVVAEGTEQALQRLLAFLQRGSLSSRVDLVDSDWLEATGEFDRFQVRYSY
jgi:acylphosphatase